MQHNPATTTSFLPTEKQIESLRMQKMFQKTRKRIEILLADKITDASKQIVSETFNGEHKVHASGTAKEAWTWFLTNAPDITIIQTDLPDVDGHKLAKIIKVVDPSAFVIMVYPAEDEKNIEHAKEAGADGMLIKPYAPKSIVNALQPFMNTRKPAKK